MWSVDLWIRVGSGLAGEFVKKEKKRRESFAFASKVGKKSINSVDFVFL